MSLLLKLLSLDILLKALCILIFLGIVFIVFLTIYIHYKRSLYKHIPGPKIDNFFLGNIPSLQRQIYVDKKPLLDLWYGWHLEFGSAFVLWAYFTPVVTVFDPEEVKKVLITLNLPKSPETYSRVGFPYGQRFAGNGLLTETNHEIWKKKRSRLDKGFHRSYLINLMESFNGICDVFFDKIGKLADGKTEVEMSDEFGRVTLDVIGKVRKQIYMI